MGNTIKPFSRDVKEVFGTTSSIRIQYSVILGETDNELIDLTPHKRSGKIVAYTFIDPVTKKWYGILWRNFPDNLRGGYKETYSASNNHYVMYGEDLSWVRIPDEFREPVDVTAEMAEVTHLRKMLRQVEQHNYACSSIKPPESYKGYETTYRARLFNEAVALRKQELNAPAEADLTEKDIELCNAYVDKSWYDENIFTEVLKLATASRDLAVVEYCTENLFRSKNKYQLHEEIFRAEGRVNAIYRAAFNRESTRVLTLFEEHDAAGTPSEWLEDKRAAEEAAQAAVQAAAEAAATAAAEAAAAAATVLQSRSAEENAFRANLHANPYRFNAAIDRVRDGVVMPPPFKFLSTGTHFYLSDGSSSPYLVLDTSAFVYQMPNGRGELRGTDSKGRKVIITRK